MGTDRPSNERRCFPVCACPECGYVVRLRNDTLAIGDTWSRCSGENPSSGYRFHSTSPTYCVDRVARRSRDISPTARARYHTLAKIFAANSQE